MANLTETQKEMMNKLYKEYGLSKEDVFDHKNFKIITRAGIEKILAKSNVDVLYEIIYCGSYKYFEKTRKVMNKSTNKLEWEKEPRDGFMVVVKATATKPDVAKTIVTFSSASPETSESGYYAEMAEKRAMSRAVLKMEGFYQLGFFGEDEADDFKKKESNVKV